jgi:6-pyruvoyltetrahydropterin/6-carboxytetrahydropterin synthase
MPPARVLPRGMFSLAVRDHVMIAHSFRGAVFGPAQRLHGATYVVDVEVRTPELDGDGLVIDIGLLAKELGAALEPWRFQNLDEVADFAGKNTTTEFLARALHQRLAARLRTLHKDGVLAMLPAAMKVSLHESHVAWATYDAAF